MQAADRTLTRAINQFAILNEIRKNGLVSRVELSEITGQSRASVTNITAFLLKQGIIREERCTCPPTKGRRRVMLSLSPDAAFVAGVKISAFQISFAIINFQAEVLSSLVMPIRTGERTEDFMADVIEEGIRHCAHKAKLSTSDLSGVGIGIPGFVDGRGGACHWNPLFKEKKISLKDLIHQRLGIEVHIENDANAVTVGQQWFGQGQGVENFLVVTIEHGVGMGIVVHDRLYRGATGIGAEFGHMILRPGGEPCRCGKNGCIEGYVSDMSILRRAREVLGQRTDSGLDLAVTTIEDVTRMARKGDASLRKLFSEAGDVLGQGVAGLIQIFNPERVIVTGEGVRAGDMLFDPMLKAIEKYCNNQMAAATEVIVQEWTDDDWARGAAGLVLSYLYRAPLERVKSLI